MDIIFTQLHPYCSVPFPEQGPSFLFDKVDSSAFIYVFFSSLLPPPIIFSSTPFASNELYYNEFMCINFISPQFLEDGEVICFFSGSLKILLQVIGLNTLLVIGVLLSI